MALQDYYYSIDIQRYQEPTTVTDDDPFALPVVTSVAIGYQTVANFMGLIQKPKNYNRFVNGKQGAGVEAVLFCASSQVFESKDVLVDKTGLKYKISGSNTGNVCGITPKTGYEHAEYDLEFTNEGL